MFSVLRKWFRKCELLPPRNPRVGEQWLLRSEDRWGSKYSPVTILDVRDGWVRYNMNRVFRDERMRMDMFIATYQIVGETE